MDEKELQSENYTLTDEEGNELQFEVIASAEIGIPFFGAMIGLSPLAIPFILRRLLHRSDYHGLRVRYRLRLPDHLLPDGVLILTHFNSRRLRDGAHTVTLYAEGGGSVNEANMKICASTVLHVSN